MRYRCKPLPSVSVEATKERQECECGGCNLSLQPSRFVELSFVGTACLPLEQAILGSVQTLHIQYCTPPDHLPPLLLRGPRRSEMQVSVLAAATESTKHPKLFGSCFRWSRRGLKRSRRCELGTGAGEQTRSAKNRPQVSQLGLDGHDLAPTSAQTPERSHSEEHTFN